MAWFGTVGRLTTCPRCHGRNGVVWMQDAGGACRACLYCGWYGYADRESARKESCTGAFGPETEAERREQRPMAVSS